MTDEHRHAGYEAALTQLARSVDELTSDVDRLVSELREQAVLNAVEHAEYRADIARIYAAFSDHLRNGHGT